MIQIIAIYIGLVVVAGLCVYNLWNNHFVYSQFKNFNENIKDWSTKIDESTRAAIDRQCMYILSTLDDKIDDYNNNLNKVEENDESESDETE